MIVVGLADVRRPAAESDRSAVERKAQFLLELLQVTGWPADAFRDAAEPLRLQIVGEAGDVGSALERILNDRIVGGRRVVVSKAASPVVEPPPHVAFVSATLEQTVAAVLAGYCRRPVLTVSDMPRFANRGGVLGLVEGGVSDLILDDHGVHFVVNRTAAYEAHLQVGAEMLYLAYPLFSAVSPCPAERR